MTNNPMLLSRGPKYSFWTEIVFSRSASILNLLAFIAHAVIGCCGHHQHEKWFECCTTATQHRQSASEVACCDSDSGHFNDDASANHCSNDISGEPGNDGDRHGCTEGRCSYVGNGTSVDGLMKLVGGIPAIWYGTSLDIAWTSPYRAGYFLNASKTWWATAPALCAALQSWQI